MLMVYISVQFEKIFLTLKSSLDESVSLALRLATTIPRSCVLMRSLIAKPAASSLALFTRKPEDKRCMVVLKEAPDSTRLRCALMEGVLVLMVDAIANGRFAAVV